MDYSVFMGVKTQEERIQAVFQLLVENSPRSVTLLQEGLRIDTSPIVRHECAYSLGELSFEDGYEALTKAITQDENKFVVHEAALALSNLGVEVAYTVLEDLLNNSNQDIVLTAEISLERLRMKLSGDKIEGKEKAEAMLLDLTTHPEHRIQSAFILMEEGSEESISLLLEGLQQETDPIVKHEIIFALGETASYLVIDPLIESMISDENVFVKHEAALALGTIGNLAAESAISSLLTHHDADIVESAEIALERLRS